MLTTSPTTLNSGHNHRILACTVSPLLGLVSLSAGNKVGAIDAAALGPFKK